MDAAQIMNFPPPAPAKLLDVGVGSGWTSELFAKAGYEVTGIDISPDMIALAKLRDCSARFVVSDYEVGPIAGKFDAAVIYDERDSRVVEFDGAEKGCRRGWQANLRGAGDYCAQTSAEFATSTAGISVM